MGSRAGIGGGNFEGVLSAIAAPLTIEGGQDGVDRLSVDDSGDIVGRTGTLSATTISGLGLTAAFVYTGIGSLHVLLGGGDDAFHIAGTHTGTTRVSAGPGDDLVTVATVQGDTRVEGDDPAGLARAVALPAGTSFDDRIFVNVDAAGNETHANGVGALLSIDGGRGSDEVTVFLANVPYSTAHPLSTIAVHDSGTDGTDRLDVYGTDDETTGDRFLLRSNFLALLPRVSTEQTSERVDYDSTLEGGLFVFGRAGEDSFALDDDSTVTTIDGGVGDDTFQIGQLLLSNGTGRDTTILGGEGDDSFTVFHNRAELHLDGGPGDDVFTADDTGDTQPNAGTLTSSSLAGLGLFAPIDYTRFEHAVVILGSGNDTLTVESTHTGTTSVDSGGGDDEIDVRSISGPTRVAASGDDLIQVGSRAGIGGGNFEGVLSAIAAPLTIEGGQDGVDRLSVDDSGDIVGRTGTLSATTISGLGLTAAFVYTGIGSLHVLLGGGDDAFHIAGTHTGTTRVSAGPGDDLVTVATVQGDTRVEGDDPAGLARAVALPAATSFDDRIFVNVDAAGNETHANGVGALLSIDGGRGSDEVTVFLANVPYSTAHPLSTIVVHDSGTDGTDRLDVYGTDDETTGDRFLLRSNFLALLPRVSTEQTSERVDYDSTLEGGLFVFGRAGEDSFALDDDSTVTTIDGGVGDDTFQIGQLFQSPREATDTIETAHGFLSNGTGRDTTILGGEGDDSFTVFHNRADLHLDGGPGDDSFVLRAFALAGSTVVDPDLGGDVVVYAENASVDIDGGTGVNSGAVLGTEFADTFVVTPDGVSGAGLQSALDGVERLQGDGLEGNDRFVVLGTSPSVSTALFGGIASDTFDLGGDPAASPRTLRDVQGPLTIDGGVDPDTETSIPIPLLDVGELDTHIFVSAANPNLLVQEAEQVDAATVLDTDNLADAAGVLTDARITGFGMGAGGISYNDLELLRLELGGGSDRLLVESTHGGETEVNGGGGNDELHVRTVAGTTTIRGEAGDDTVDVGTSFDASWFGAAVDDEAAPPAGTIDRIRALLRVDGGTGNDTVRVDDSGDSTSDVATITGRTLDGLDLASALVWTVTLAHPGPGTFTLTAGGRTTAPLPIDAGAGAIKAALLGLAVPHVTDVTVNRAGDVLTIGFLGGEALEAADVMLAADAADAAVAAVAAQSLVQALQVNATAGTYSVTVGAGLATFTFAVGASADAFRDALIAAIRSAATPVVSADGLGVETKDVLVDLVGSTYYVTYQGLLRGLAGDRFGLAVSPKSVVTSNAGSSDVTIDAFGGTYALVVNGVQTYPLAAASGAAAIAAALNALLGPTLVAELTPGTFHIAGLPSSVTVDDRNLVAPVVVSSRRSGIDYAGIERLKVDTGSGDDVVDVRGTTAVTDVYAHAGDDRFYVSSLAGETLASARTTDYLEGNLDAVLGNLNLSGSDGRHKLFISDEAAVAGDSDVHMTDHPVAASRLASAEIEIAGLAPASIDFGASAAGTFADGITVWTGFGADTITVDGTHNRAVPGMRTITMLNTGLGDDVVTVNLKAGEDGFFVLDTQGPYDGFTSVADADTVIATASTLPLVIFGGQDDDKIAGGSGGDMIFGDRGRVLYFDDGVADPNVDDATLAALTSAAVTVLGEGGPGDRTDGVVRRASVAVSVDPAIGGNDTVDVPTGSSVVIGGAGNDSLTLGRDTNLAFGDSAFVKWGTSSEITEAASFAPGVGGNDAIALGSGRALVLGGQGGDTITGGTGGNVIVGDNGEVDGVAGNPLPWGGLPLTLALVKTTQPGIGGSDAITIVGNDVVLAGAGADKVTTGAGASIVLGDDGSVSWGREQSRDWIAGVASIDPGDGGNDVIALGAGRAVAVGGQGGDTITGTTGAYILVGDNARIDGVGQNPAPLGGLPITIGSVSSTDPLFGGDDTISGGTVDDLIIGGVGNDTISAGDGRNLVIGDNGTLVFFGVDPDPNTLDLAQTILPAFGGDDRITASADNDAIFGGVGSDTIDAGGGDNLVYGDDGAALFEARALVRVGSLDSGDEASASGGDDAIIAGPGRDAIVGGLGNDRITTGDGQNVVFGDSGAFTFSVTTGGLVSGAAIAPSLGGSDSITGGSARDVIAGGGGGDTIDGGGGDDVIAGDSAEMSFDVDGSLGFVATSGAGFGGSDAITTGAGADLVFGGFGSDRIDTHDGDDVVFGDDGSAVWGSTLIRMRSIDTGDDGSAIGGDDVITTGLGRDVVAGGMGDDRIDAAGDADVVFGDSGAFTFSAATGGLTAAASTAPSFGGSDVILAGDGRDVVVGGFGGDTIGGGGGGDVVAGDGARMTFDTDGALSSLATDGTGFGGNDTITTGPGGDVVFGGFGNDTIDARGGDDVVFGDDGAASWHGPTLVRVESIDTGDDGPAFGGDDAITTGLGRDVVAGGVGNDKIDSADSGDVVFGDSAAFTFSAASDLVAATSIAPSFGGNDQVIGGAGGDVIVGGDGSDTIKAGIGDNVVAGDSATMAFAGGVLHYFATFGTGLGDDDEIVTGPGDDVVFGGFGNDSIKAGDGSNVVFGDDGAAVWGGRTLVRVRSINTGDDGPAFGGNDVISTGSGPDLVIGGFGNDRIDTDGGDDVVFGDSGVFTFADGSGLRVSGATTAPAFGGSDVIRTGEGDDVIAGGPGDDTINAGRGDDVVAGDGARMSFDRRGRLNGFATTAGGIGGNDSITTGRGNDIVFGGAGRDAIHTGGGHARVFDADGSAKFFRGKLTKAKTIVLPFKATSRAKKAKAAAALKALLRARTTVPATLVRALRKATTRDAKVAVLNAQKHWLEQQLRSGVLRGVYLEKVRAKIAAIERTVKRIR